MGLLSVNGKEESSQPLKYNFMIREEQSIFSESTHLLFGRSVDLPSIKNVCLSVTRIHVALLN